MTVVYGVNLPTKTSSDEGYYFEGTTFYNKLFSTMEEATKFALTQTIELLLSANDYGLDEGENDSIITYVNKYRSTSNDDTYTCEYEDYELTYNEGSDEVDLKYMIEKTDVLNNYLESLYEILELEVP